MAVFFHLRRPAAVLGTLDAGEPFSYPDVGATNAEPPENWPTDREVGEVGSGEQVWRRLRDAVSGMRMFTLPWVHLLSAPRVVVGEPVVFAARQFGMWTYNTCRIVYVIDEEDDDEVRYGFAYGTLKDHAVAGEERFLAKWDKRTDVVTFEVYKFSLPRHPLVRALFPVTRAVQKRFSREVVALMREIANPV